MYRKVIVFKHIMS